jgi:hypothetical protein
MPGAAVGMRPSAFLHEAELLYVMMRPFAWMDHLANSSQEDD